MDGRGHAKFRAESIERGETMGARDRANVTFIGRLVAEIEDVRRTGAADARAIAEALNARRVTSRKGRPWSAATVARFMESPGARRHGLAPPGRRGSGGPPA